MLISVYLLFLATNIFMAYSEYEGHLCCFC
jgi:hypothetical protein